MATHRSVAAAQASALTALGNFAFISTAAGRRILKGRCLRRITDAMAELRMEGEVQECGLLALTNLATAGRTPAQIDKIAEQTLKALQKSMATVAA
eukprot:4549486-Amphidinium_carterae.1